MTRLKVGIAGCGLVTQVEHLPNLINLPALFDVVAIADPSVTVRNALAARHGLHAFESATEMMDASLDAVVIATPDSYHADLAVAALERGLHVFSVKPLSYNTADIANGQRRFATCRSCHTLTEGGASMTGPNLHGLFGRKAATHGTYKYSDALKASGITWDAASLDKWIENPREVVPGTKMAFAGIKTPKDRIDLIGYLMAETGAAK